MQNGRRKLENIRRLKGSLHQAKQTKLVKANHTMRQMHPSEIQLLSAIEKNNRASETGAYALL